MINFIIGIVVGAAAIMGIFTVSFFDSRWEDGWNHGVEARHMMDELRDLTQKWIPCKIGLPKPFKEVLVWNDRDKNIDIMQYHEGAWGYTADSDDFKMSEITAWMPLPKDFER